MEIFSKDSNIYFSKMKLTILFISGFLLANCNRNSRFSRMNEATEDKMDEFKSPYKHVKKIY